MKAIWTQEEMEYHGDLVHIEKMNPVAEAGANTASAYHCWRGISLRRSARHRTYGNGWIPRADRLRPRTELGF